jgi:hypothetical protein
MSPVAARRREAFLRAAGSSLPPQLQRLLASKKTVEAARVARTTLFRLQNNIGGNRGEAPGFDK